MSVQPPTGVAMPPEGLVGADPRTIDAIADIGATITPPRLRVLRSKTFLVGAAVLAFWAFMALAWRVVVPYDPQALDPTATLAGPSGAHWFGTDNLGRDVLSRVLAGAAPVLAIAPLATALGLVLGTVTGLVSGYYRGVVDETLMRIVDALLSFPIIILAALVLVTLGSSARNVVLVIGIVFAPLIARTVRSAVLAEREREYVRAARLRGQHGPSIMVTEILPNIRGPLAVEATIRFGYAVFTSATLSFLTLGVQQPSPEWGLTVSLGRQYLQIAPWMVLFPAAALATLVISINLLAEGARQASQEH